MITERGQGVHSSLNGFDTLHLRPQLSAIIPLVIQGVSHGVHEQFYVERVLL